MPKKPPIRLRRVNTKKNARPAQTEEETAQGEPAPLSAAEKQENQAVQWVMHHAQYPNFLSAIRMGTTNADIADHFIDRGYVQVTRKTLMIYLAAFRRKCPDLCRPRSGILGRGTDVDGNAVELRDYDHLFDGNMTALSLEVEMMKLIQVQKQRIAIDYHSERQIGKLFQTTAKEVQVLGELFEKLHKVKHGEGKTGSGKNAFGHGSGIDVNEDSIRDGLNAIKQDETDRRITSGAIKQLIQGVVQG